MVSKLGCLFSGLISTISPDVFAIFLKQRQGALISAFSSDTPLEKRKPLQAVKHQFRVTTGQELSPETEGARLASCGITSNLTVGSPHPHNHQHPPQCCPITRRQPETDVGGRPSQHSLDPYFRRKW